jgi:superfamily I DNA and/or RNA helicase
MTFNQVLVDEATQVTEPAVLAVLGFGKDLTFGRAREQLVR